MDKFKDDELEVARLRTAWGVARAQLVKTFEQAKQGGHGADNPDLDAPLSASEEKERSQTFSEARPGWVFEAEDMPVKAILGRTWREFNGSSRSVTVVPLKRFRAEADLQGQKQPKDDTIKLGGGYELKHSDDASKLPDQELTNILVVLHCIRLMVHAWALCGAGWADSKEHFDMGEGKPEKVRMCHMSVGLS